MILITLIFCAGIASLPYWMPFLIIRLRIWIFTRINGEEGVSVPGKQVDVSRFKEIYGHPAANGRSQGARLSDLFWYWLSPGPEMHQEHLEAGARYEAVARTTRQILSLPKKSIADAAAASIGRVLAEKKIAGPKLLRLRDLMMPIWADFYYTLVFGEKCPTSARDLIEANANDVVNALKMTSLRHMERRHRLTRFLVKRLEAGELAHLLPQGFTIQERAFYLQGAFFNTAVVQTSEALTHLLLFIAQNQSVQTRLFEHPEDEIYLEHVITESLRVHPLFGIAHRITNADIANPPHSPIPRGSVLCFNYTDFHHTGYESPKHFDPDRWKTLSPRESNYLPFGSPSNRACPAQGAALTVMRTATREILKEFALYSSAVHTRSIPNRGPCLFVSRQRKGSDVLRGALLLFMRARERWEEVGRCFLQLVLGSYMIWEARRLHLCKTFFEGAVPADGKAGRDSQPSKCPFSWLTRQPSRESRSV